MRTLKKFFSLLITVMFYMLINGIVLAASGKTGGEWAAYAIQKLMK